MTKRLIRICVCETDLPTFPTESTNPNQKNLPMKLLKYTLLSVLLIGSTGTFTSCKKDPCKDKTCNNGGTCDDGTCLCAAGYEGEECSTQIRSKFLSSYNVSESCPSGNFTYTISITTSSQGISQVLISNFGGYGVSVNATASGSSLNVPTQQVDISGNSATFSGSGQLSGNILTMTYTISGGGASETCTMTCTKQ